VPYCHRDTVYSVAYLRSLHLVLNRANSWATKGDSLYYIMLPPGSKSRVKGGVVKTSHVTFDEFTIDDYRHMKFLESANDDYDEPIDEYFSFSLEGILPDDTPTPDQR